jgi:hypothetical protein
MADIEKATGAIQLNVFDGPPRTLLRDLAARREAVFSSDSRNDGDAERKQAALEEQLEASDTIRQVGDLLVAAFFQGANARARANLEEETIRRLNSGMSAEDVATIRSELAAGPKGIRPFHWELEFPEVFQDGRGGFDAFVGNPPFAGDVTFTNASKEGFFDWLKNQYQSSGGRTDLVAFFFRRCFQLLRPHGTFGLIATNTIAQGDTRYTGLQWICTHEGTIYSARRRYRWPGVAAVVVSIVHLCKGAYDGEKRLDGQPVPQITAFLFDKGGHDSPRKLTVNKEKSFNGSKVYGQGFLFENSDTVDTETSGTPSPLALMESLVEANPRNKEVIFPYMGGEDLNDDPSQSSKRYVIDFRDRPEEACRSQWPDIFAILESKVKPERTRKKASGEFLLRSPLPQRWWQHGDMRPSLYRKSSEIAHVIVCSAISKHPVFSRLRTGTVYSHNLVVITEEAFSWLAVLQSQPHTFFAGFFSSSLEDRQGYRPTDGFEPFPFPTAVLDLTDADSAIAAERQRLEAIGEGYHQFRAELMIANNEGLTNTYNRFHDPSETSDGILELRSLHQQMDQAVLHAYGWEDIPTTCGFGLDYLDSDDDTTLPPDLQERIASGDLFFPTASKACAFQSQLRQYGVVKPSKKLPWRHRWPDEVRDDVLARLLALNAERYAEEQAIGLQGKISKPGAGGDRKRKGGLANIPQSNTSNATQVEQIGLAL